MLRGATAGISGLQRFQCRLTQLADLHRFVQAFIDVQADTIVPDSSLPQPLNRYSYTLGNPLRYTDPSGHFDVPTDEEGNLTPTCGELCQLLGFETFDAFASWLSLIHI